ncbi:MAG: membrane dipeptidase [Deltaproteobacteria bacterium]|nr:membrane dipeptidase [Deltaproteobacteria bacterium]
MPNKDAFYMLRGAIDIHVHAEPDIHPRRLDCIELAEEARKLQMAGILIKDHNTITSDRAYIINKIFPDIKLYGAMALNPSVGGLNPAAVESAIRLGCREVFMPTSGAQNHVSKWGAGPHSLTNRSRPPDQGICILDEKGRLYKDVLEILRLIAENDVILGTGHLSVTEIMAVTKCARDVGVKRILITHPSMKIIDMPVSCQVEVARMGAYLDHSFLATTNYFSESERTSMKEIAYQIHTVGIDHCVMSTDFGQENVPSPTEGLKTFIDEMLAHGFKEEEIRKMIIENPKKLLEV